MVNTPTTDDNDVCDGTLVFYPDAARPGGFGRYVCHELLHEYGRHGVVYGRIPHNHGRNGQYHAYLVINMVRGTIDFYSASEANAFAQMLQLEQLWDAADEGLAYNLAQDAQDIDDADNSVEEELEVEVDLVKLQSLN